MAFLRLGKIDFSKWIISGLQTSAKGQKSAPIFADSKPCPNLQLCTVDKPMLAPFGASAYGDVDNKATRLNMELDLCDEQCKHLSALDEWAQEQAKKLGLRGEYRPCVGIDKHGNRRLRAKVSTSGVHAAKFSESMRAPLGTAKDLELTGASISPVVTAKNLWTMAGQYGICMDLRHAVVNLQSQECPELV